MSVIAKRASRWVLALLAIAPPVAAACQGEERRLSEQDWQVACQCSAAERRCVAYTEVIGTVGGVWGTAHALSVSANRPGDYRLGWNPRLFVPDGKHPLMLKVDEQRFRRSLSAGKTGYRGTELEGYRLETSAALVTALKEGRELRIAYTDIFQNDAAASFSLKGLSKALAFADAQLAGTTQSAAAKSGETKP